jgi:hypothetical protein
MGLISIILWVVSIVGFIFWNLWQRNEKLEQLANKQAKVIEETKNAVNVVTQMFDKIDEENIFRANDYVGQMWLELKSLNEQLKNYK